MATATFPDPFLRCLLEVDVTCERWIESARACVVVAAWWARRARQPHKRKIPTW